MQQYDPPIQRFKETDDTFDGNYCSRCDRIIDTEDCYEPACNCTTEVENWSDSQFQKEWDNLPSHIQENFHPPTPTK